MNGKKDSWIDVNALSNEDVNKSGFSREELSLLAQHVTNPLGNVFCVTNLPGITGPIFARYSRAQGGFREILTKEFLKEGKINAKKADNLIARVLVAYGDDSVGELEGTHLALEQISNLATKIVEDCRIGGSPIEQSTRYVFYDQKDREGKFKYLREKKIMASPHAQHYTETMDFLFQTYCDLIKPLQEHFTKLKPLQEAEYNIKGTGNLKLKDLQESKDIDAFKRTYDTDIRTKACDTTRTILPASTLTNVGLYGNGRFYQGLLTKLFTDTLTEPNELANLTRTELDKTMPQFIKRAKTDEYSREREYNMHKLAQEILKGIHPEKESPVVLLDNQPNLINIAAECLFKYSQHPTQQIRNIISNLPPQKTREIIHTYNGPRKTRRDRPGIALEFGYPLTFDLLGDFGIYRDLQRHRMLTQERQELTPYLGFFIPQEIIDAGLTHKITLCKEKSIQLYEALHKDFPKEAQYAVLFGFNIRFRMGMNFREAMHMWELRTTPQGHPNYRKMCQHMHNAIKQKHPEMAELLTYVDHNEYFWSRADSEAKQRRKEQELDNKD